MQPDGGSQDPHGAYVRRWVPELAGLPTKYIHKPWTAPATVLTQVGQYTSCMTSLIFMGKTSVRSPRHAQPRV